MKFQKSTLILILAALLLAGIVYIWEKEGRPQIEAAKRQENLIFGFQEKDVNSVDLTTKDYRLQFERNSQKGNNVAASKWLLKILEGPKETEQAKDTASTPSPEATATPLPEATSTPSPEATATKSPAAKPTPSPEATATKSPAAKPTPSPGNNTAAKLPEGTATPSPVEPTASPSPEAKPAEQAKETFPRETVANEAYVAYLLDLLAKAKGDRIPADPRLEDGLNQPLATIEVKLNNQQTHKLILGNANYNNTSLYALADPPEQITQSPQIVLVSPDFKNAIDRPLSEWEQPQEKKPSSDKRSEQRPAENSQTENQEGVKKDDQQNSVPKDSDVKKQTPAPAKPKI